MDLMYTYMGICKVNFRFLNIIEFKSTLRAIIRDGFVSNPFEPDTLFQQQKRVSRKYRSLQQFLTAQKDLF
jgi:hypothetical protein